MKLDIQLFSGSCSIGNVSESVNTENNQSKFTIPATLTSSGSTYNSSGAYMTLQWKYQSSSSWTTISKKTFGISQNSSVSKSWTLTLTHNTDGTLGKVQFRVKWYITDSTNGTSSTKTITPTTINRYPKIKSLLWVGDKRTGSPITIKWESYNSSWTYDLEIYYGDGSSGTLYYTYENIGSSVGEHLFDVTIGNDYFNQFPNDTIAQIGFRIDTANAMGEPLDIYVTTINLNSNAIPTLSIGTITEADTTMQGLNWGIFVQNHSKLNIPITATGVVGSKISGVSAITNGQEFSYRPTTPTSPLTYTFTTSNELYQSGTNTFYLAGYDTRTRYANQVSATYNVVEYFNPSITMAQAQRCLQDGTLDNDGTYVKFSFSGAVAPVSNHNASYFRISYKKTTEDNYTDVLLSTSYTYNQSDVVSSFTISKDYTYDIKFSIEDSFTTTEIVRTLDTGFDLLNFNPSGKAMAIGKVSEAGANEEKLEVALHTTFIPDIDMYSSIEIDSSNRNEASITYFNEAKTKGYVAGYGTLGYDGFGIYSAETNQNVMTVDKNGYGIFTGGFQTANYGLNGDFGLTRIFRELLGSSTGAEDADLDNFYDTGIYRCYPSTSHKPDVDISGFATYGICIVIKSYDWWYQIYIGNWGTPRIATRIKTGTNNWETWVGI